MNYKVILSGRLEFGNIRSCEKAMQLFQNRYEIIYRHDIFLKAQDIFQTEQGILELYRFTTMTAEKTWNNTIQVLEEVARYAIMGRINAWLTDNGQILQERTIEPNTEKAAVQAYINGRQLVFCEGREMEAIQSFNQAIEKYERHAAAYERRGYVNYRLRKYADAIYDYSKSIMLNPAGAEAYLGRAVAHIAQDNPAAALPDLEKAINFSVPLQPIYWIARRIKGDCHLDLEQYEAATKEYQFFLQRKFQEDDVNFRRRRRVAFRMGKALLGMHKYKEAALALETALKIQSDDSAASDADIRAWHNEALKRQSAPAAKASKSSVVA